MSFKTNKKELVELMQSVYPIVPLKSTLQILSNLKISLTDNNLEITATDLDHSIKVKTEVQGEGGFSIAVNAKKLFEIVRELPEGDITIAVDENVFIIASESGFSCKIAGADTQDFPGFPAIEEKESFSIPMSLLSEIIAKSSFAVSKDESRASLCGVLFEVQKDKVGMVATDGHRLGKSFVNGDFSVSNDISVIASPKSLLHIVRIVGSDSKEENINITIGERYISLNTSKLELCSKLIDGPYPDYKKVIPRDNPKSVVIEKGSLIASVKRVSVLSNQKTNLVRFNFKENELELVVSNRDIGGEARETVPIEYSDEDHTIGFNAHYLVEILGIINASKIKLEMNTQISACLIFPEYDNDKDKKSDNLFLIMPLRIMEEI